MKSHFDQLDEIMDRTRETNQLLAGLEHDVRQPRLAMKGDVTSDKKTRKRTKGAAAGRAMSGDKSFARVDHDPMCVTSFGDDSTGPPALPCCRDDALVDKGAEAPKLCLSPVEIRTLTAAGGLLPTGTSITATRIIFRQPPLWCCPTKNMSYMAMTSIQYATYSSSSKMKVLETKIRQTMVFDAGGCTDRLRACPFLGVWRALLCGQVFVWTLQ